MLDEITLKIIFAGDYRVGKTALLRRWSGLSMRQNYKANIGVDFQLKRIQIDSTIYRVRKRKNAKMEKLKWTYVI